MDTSNHSVPAIGQNLDQLTAQLELGGADASASHVQGIVCGLLSAGTSLTAATWPRLIMSDENTDEPLSPALTRALGDLTDHSRRMFDSTEFEFALLIPEDTAPVEDRTEALREWCQGFLLGLFADGEREPHALPGDAREIVRDIIEIAGTEVDTDDDAGQGSEEDEAALMEIEEYLRVGAQLVFEELRDEEVARARSDSDASGSTSSSSGKPSPTVH